MYTRVSCRAKAVGESPLFYCSLRKQMSENREAVTSKVQEIAERVVALGLHVRAGVHTGECELIDGKYGGLTVSIGARVAASASPSQVLITQTVKDLTAGSGLTLEDAGEHEFKGVPDRWHLYRVVT